MERARNQLLPAAAIGILADGLLRGAEWGLNVPLCILGLALTASFLPTGREPERHDGSLLAWAAVIASMGIAWRSAPPLVMANLVATMALLLLALVRAARLRLDSIGLLPLTRATIRAGSTVAAGAFPWLAEWKPNPAAETAWRWKAVFIGVGIAIPVSAVFTGLLANADPLFERAVNTLFSWNGQLVATHVALSAGFTWLASGYLIGFRRPQPASPVGNVPSPSSLFSTIAPVVPQRLGLIEIGIPLSVLAGIFAVFVGLQARYYFGGVSVVLSTAGLGWGEYARRGFFELVAVTVLVLPLLLAADAAIDRDDSRTMRGFRSLAVILLGLVSLIAASAVYRLWLYYGVYGLSPTRIYAAALMLWITTVLGWFSATVLRERRGPFAIGALVSGLVVLAGLNIANPDALVARVNLRRAAEGANVDIELLRRLSPDAAPALVNSLRQLPEAQRCKMAMAVSTHWRDAQLEDWRAWSIARRRATTALGDLSALCVGGSPPS
jgi:hypothetical protein